MPAMTPAAAASRAAERPTRSSRVPIAAPPTTAIRPAARYRWSSPPVPPPRAEVRIRVTRVPVTRVVFSTAPSRHIVALRRPIARARSEEHTSELQSRENLVCRLLLEKKKLNQHEMFSDDTIFIMTYTEAGISEEELVQNTEIAM